MSFNNLKNFFKIKEESDKSKPLHLILTGNNDLNVDSKK